MSTSKLQRYTSKQLYKRFGKYGLVENTRPDWLISSKGERLELDFFIDKLSIAVEVQGRQHLEFTPLFHTTEYDFQEQIRRDREKQRLCADAGVSLLYVYKTPDVGSIIADIFEAIDRQLAPSYDRKDDVFALLPTFPRKPEVDGINQIREAMKGYKRYQEKGRDCNDKIFNILCAGIRRALERYNKLSDNELSLLAEAVRLKKELSA